MKKLIRIVFFLPLSVVYGLLIVIRNKLFDGKILRGKKFPVPIISVGNLSMGGTGKTPQVEYLIRLLKEHKRVAVLSRGYKRKTRGFLEATPQSTHLDVGDEPMQYVTKYPDVTVAVCAKRAKGIAKLLAKPEPPEVIILDDAFQHRYVKPSLNILLTDYYNLYVEDFILPSGSLREFRRGAKRADIVVVTKTNPVLPSVERKIIQEKLHLQPHQKLYFSYINYLQPVSIYDQQKTLPERVTTIFMIAGIANPYPFERHLQGYCIDLRRFIFSDHHRFTEKEVAKIIKKFNLHLSKNKVIVTTEKDAQRLKTEPFCSLLKDYPVYYVPIQVAFHEDEKCSFDSVALNHFSL
ncbi:MAG: tetraacyldisaccharide 4'-kinase [Bacteroidales bacterium]|nr:tetraacyldisaccharide 4'-kinase [Bacteroidales bacterium]